MRGERPPHWDVDPHTCHACLGARHISSSSGPTKVVCSPPMAPLLCPARLPTLRPSQCSLSATLAYYRTSRKRPLKRLSFSRRCSRIGRDASTRATLESFACSSLPSLRLFHCSLRAQVLRWCCGGRAGGGEGLVISLLAGSRSNDSVKSQLRPRAGPCPPGAAPDDSGRHLFFQRRSRRISPAAFRPAAPMTPGPGWVPAPQR